MSLIVIIEDNDEIRENTLEILELEGFSALGARDGEEGLKLVLEFQPSLVISDVHMPGKNGYAVLDELKRSGAAEKTALVFLTSDCERKDIEAGLRNGAVGYLTKPFETTDLLHVVKKYCKEAG